MPVLFSLGWRKEKKKEKIVQAQSYNWLLDEFTYY